MTSCFHTLSNIFRAMWCLIRATWFIASTYCSYLFTKDVKKFSRELCETLAKKNVLYVKLFQSVALNAKWIDDDLHTELLKYTDRVFWEPSSIDWDVIFALETEHNIQFSDGYTPINSGMISIVFKVTNKNTGEQLALKMKRKNIDVRLENSIKEFESIAYFASFIPMFNALQLGDIIKENINTIKEQTDFEKEIQNMNDIRANCANIHYIKIPRVCSAFFKYPNIIMMEFIEGKTITEIDLEDREEFAKLVIKFAFVNLLIHGVMHADMHSGNLIFIKNAVTGTLKERRLPKYQLGVIDFGIMCRIDNDFQNLMFDIFERVQKVSGREFIELAMHMVYDLDPHLEQIGSHHYDEMMKGPAEIVDRMFYNNGGAKLNILFEICDILFDTQKYLKQERVLTAPLLMNPNYIKLQTILAMVQGVIIKLCAENCIDLMNVVFSEMFGSTTFTVPDMVPDMVPAHF